MHKLWSASLLKLYKFDYVDRELNSMDPDETPSYSAFYLDPSCLHMATAALNKLRFNKIEAILQLVLTIA